MTKVVDYKKALEDKEREVLELKNAIKNLEGELMESKDRIKYLQADFDNLWKYFEKEKVQIIKLSNKDLIKNMLEVLDDFEGALKNAGDNEMEGVMMIHNKLMQLLNKNGLECIKCVGEKFNPQKHEALMKEGDDELITMELQKGYSLNGSVIRASKVKIGGALK